MNEIQLTNRFNLIRSRVFSVSSKCCIHTQTHFVMQWHNRRSCFCSYTITIQIHLTVLKRVCRFFISVKMKMKVKIKDMWKLQTNFTFILVKFSSGSWQCKRYILHCKIWRKAEYWIQVKQNLKYPCDNKYSSRRIWS